MTPPRTDGPAIRTAGLVKRYEDVVWFANRDEIADWYLKSNTPAEPYKPIG